MCELGESQAEVSSHAGGILLWHGVRMYRDRHLEGLAGYWMLGKYMVLLGPMRQNSCEIRANRLPGNNEPLG